MQGIGAGRPRRRRGSRQAAAGWRRWAWGLWLALLPLAAGALPVGTFINEIYYNNVGPDIGEGIEVAGPAGLSLAGWQLVLYDGATGAPYYTRGLGGTIDDEGDGTGALSFPFYYPWGIQNGDPDGVALVDAAGEVRQFLSYGGSFVALSGPARDLRSLDIGRVQPDDSPLDTSLQLVGSGHDYADFVWQGPAPASLGRLNDGQTLTPVPLPKSLWLLGLGLVALILLRWGHHRS